MLRLWSSFRASPTDVEPTGGQLGLFSPFHRPVTYHLVAWLTDYATWRRHFELSNVSHNTPLTKNHTGRPSPRLRSNQSMFIPCSNQAFFFGLVPSFSTEPTTVLIDWHAVCEFLWFISQSTRSTLQGTWAILLLVTSQQMCPASLSRKSTSKKI